MKNRIKAAALLFLYMPNDNRKAKEIYKNITPLGTTRSTASLKIVIRKANSVRHPSMMPDIQAFFIAVSALLESI